ncbi:MAG: aminotransferase class IV [Melioribacteraceae bacterium]|nr:aminotransferase class IV [Melioribacteraceae bacterium]
MKTPESYCYIKGEIIPVAEASISITDSGLQRGWAIFDYVRTYNGYLFHFADHYYRFTKSAAGLNMQVPISENELKHIAYELIKKSELINPSVRMILTGGDSSSKGNARLIIIAEELYVYQDDLYFKGGKLVSVEFQRELPEIKSTNYANSFRLNNKMKQAGAFEILYHSISGVTECTRSNIFAFIDNKLVTPKDNILKGVTRKIILNLAGKNYTVETRTVTLKELLMAAEVFVTSTSKGIIPVVQIDNYKIGIGLRTTKLMNLFCEYTSNYKLKK